jgi:hypothetical protein
MKMAGMQMVITPETKLENFLISSEFKIMYPEDRKG